MGSNPIGLAKPFFLKKESLGKERVALQSDVLGFASLLLFSAEEALRKNSAEAHSVCTLFKRLSFVFYFMVVTSYGEIPDSELMFPSFPSLPSLKLNVNKLSPGRLPSNLTPALAYFIGFFCGDGGLKDIQKTFLKTKRFEYKLIIADEFEIQIKIIQKVFSGLFGFKPPIRYERILKGEHTYYLNPTNKSVYLFLTKVFGFPKGHKYDGLKVPRLIINSNSSIKKWFIRGVFDSDGDTRAVEKGFTAQSRVKLRMKTHSFITGIKALLEDTYNVSVNGPYYDKGGQSSYIQVERFNDLKSINKQKIFMHPVKRWRLQKSCSNLISSHRAQLLKQFT